MKLTLGFSPCPNDTFIFDAMIHGRVDTEDIEFDYFLADVEELNSKAKSAEVDITKISFHAYCHVAAKYIMLDSGSALGFGAGPLLIGKPGIDINSIASKKIAIPGKYTTANLLFGIAWPECRNKKEYLFSDIEEAIINGEVDAGLIIHETRFTYQKRGLVKIADMGEYWEQLVNLPVPLGTIVIKRTIPENTALKVNRILKRSLEYAISTPKASLDFVAGNAQAMDIDVMNSHINLYVNEFTLSLGSKGRAAIKKLFGMATDKKLIPHLPNRIFLVQ
ncbi:MAG: 1,4-dihydroxy-6-naphthoate synthase [Bacteroidales bacterium]|jgi:1,4-dihydroxy-6-naphthoate synthase|nr:1,4-dihydroxy-6-naphthoate synthase [Bacteroidales bacterium]